jgi:hypothetical protein
MGDAMLIQFEKIRDDSNIVPLNPTANLSVGLREGRLSERSPADRSWAAQADILGSVQGDHLSRSFKRSEFTQSFLDAFAILFAFLFVTVAGLGITAAVFMLLFVRL